MTSSCSEQLDNDFSSRKSTHYHNFFMILYLFDVDIIIVLFDINNLVDISK